MHVLDRERSCDIFSYKRRRWDRPDRRRRFAHRRQLSITGTIPRNRVLLRETVRLPQPASPWPRPLIEPEFKPVTLQLSRVIRTYYRPTGPVRRVLFAFPKTSFPVPHRTSERRILRRRNRRSVLGDAKKGHLLSPPPVLEILKKNFFHGLFAIHKGLTPNFRCRGKIVATAFRGVQMVCFPNSAT